MTQLLARLLLSVALIFQGMAGACASAPMGGTEHPSSAMADGSVEAMHASGDCSGCPSCPDQPPSHDGCTQHCSVPGELVSVLVFAPRVLPSQNVAAFVDISLIDFVQPPPTPPPIA